jgi:hypothetical protein
MESSFAGKGLYEKFGYKPIRSFYFDTRPFGGDFTDTHWVSLSSIADIF